MLMPFMKLAIMQPYFLPYLGYFQLLNSVENFVIYDDIEFTKKGWINRNRFLLNGKDYLFSLPLKKDSDYLDVKDRRLAENYISDAQKILRRIKSGYQKAPYFEETYPLIEKCFLFAESNLFKFILNSLKIICAHLNIQTNILISSCLKITPGLKGENRVIAICKYLKANNYINAIGGIELYDKNNFARNDIELSFIRMKNIHYRQFENDFIPHLSILDVMMFNDLERITEMLSEYEIINKIHD